MASIVLSSCHGRVWPKPSLPNPNWTAGNRRRGGARALRVGPRGSVVPVGRTYPVVFRDLDADDFRHPLDKQVMNSSPDLFAKFWNLWYIFLDKNWFLMVIWMSFIWTFFGAIIMIALLLLLIIFFSEYVTSEGNSWVKWTWQGFIR